MIASLVVGPPGHGVVQVATKTAAGTLVPAQRPDDLLVSALDGAAVVHVHYTDRLFGDRCEESAERFRCLAASLARPLVVTLHDLPMESQGADLYRRRSDAYRKVVAAATTVIVCSRHEAGLLEGIDAAARVRVVPLPVDQPACAEPVATTGVGVLGWIYPGKGHAEMLRALPPGISLVALGAASPGHDDLLAELQGPHFRSTGFLTDAELARALRLVAVPVAPSTTISASASIGAWLEAGRRPLVIDGPWVRELEERCPGSVTVVEAEKLREAICGALEFPESTWLGGTPVGPSSAQVAHEIRELCLEVAG